MGRGLNSQSKFPCGLVPPIGQDKVHEEMSCSVNSKREFCYKLHSACLSPCLSVRAWLRPTFLLIITWRTLGSGTVVKPSPAYQLDEEQVGAEGSLADTGRGPGGSN